MRTPLSVIKLSIDLLEAALKTQHNAAQSRNSKDQSSSNSNSLESQLSAIHSPKIEPQKPQQFEPINQALDANQAINQTIYDYINIIRDECSQEIKLVNKLIELQQLANDDYEIFETPFNVCLWLRESLSHYVLSNSKRLRLRCHNCPDNYIISSDILAFSKVITELIDNANKFAPDNSDITVAIEQYSDSIHIWFENFLWEPVNMPMDQADLSRVFDAFYRIPSDDPWKFSGMGVGLSLAQRLAHRLGGDIWFSREQSINRVTLVLPHSNSCGMDDGAFLESYVAYFVSRGKAIATPTETLQFDGPVYDYWGYHRAFIKFWHGLGDRPDFKQLSLEGDIYSFGDLLSGNYTIQLCGKCLIPKPIPEARLYHIQTCGLCGVDEFLMKDNDDAEPDNANDGSSSRHLCPSQLPTFVVVGNSNPFSRELQAEIRANKLNVIAYASCDDACSNALSQDVDLIILDGLFSRVEGMKWAKKLRHHSPFRTVPIIGLSPSTQPCTPWIGHSFTVKHYILGPVPGRYLARHLRCLQSCWTENDVPGFYWFPA